MTQVITIANAKGGAGKTTLLCSLANKFAEDGHRVAIIDTDVNQYHSHRWSERHGTPDTIAVRQQKDEKSLGADIKHIKSLEDDDAFDVILIDTAGWDSRMTVYAINFSDLVLIPTKMDEPSVERSFEMIQHVRDITETNANPAKECIVMMDVDQNTTLTKRLMELIEKQDLTLVGQAIPHSTHFKEMLTRGGGPIGRAKLHFARFFAAACNMGLFDLYPANHKEAVNG